MGGLLGVIGMDGPWDIRRMLGTVPVEADGSAKFRVPANTPISIQPLDAEGKAVQIMRSWTTAMPGENLSCIGCHERQNSAPVNAKAIAFSREPSEIKPWYGPTRGFAYPREVQPVMDKYCVGCHDGKEHDGNVVFDLRGTERVKDFRMETAGNGEGHAGKFSVGYVNLVPFVRHPGIESDYHVLTPCEFHADTTRLVQMLTKGHHNVKLDAESWDRLITWIDLNTPYHGTWHEELANPGKQVQRRMELRKLYAGVEENPEEVLATDVGRVANSTYNNAPVTFVAPEPLAKAAAAAPECPGWPFDAAEATKRQTAAASASLAKNAECEVDLGNGAALKLVLIPPGEFVMGDGGGEVDERPLTRVRIAKAFWMGKLEITNRQYALFDAAHDSHVISKQAYQFGVHGFPVNEPEQPVVRVSWERAMEFCRWLSKRSGKQFSLPTEAQWEYACRAGTGTPLFYGDVNTDFSKFANVADAKLKEFATNPYTVFEPLKNPSKYDDYIPKDTRFNDGGLVTVKAGSYKPNAWGLHDMHGNAAEWTRTTYKPYPYDAADGRDNGDGTGKKVVRGGSWRDRPAFCRSAFREAYKPWQRVYDVGFRVMCEVETGKDAAVQP
jgi:formylglycine-generating enzyme required for sulfatase activity